MSSLAIDFQSIIAAAAETVKTLPSRAGPSGYGRGNQLLLDNNECFITKNRHHLGMASGIALDKVMEGSTVANDMFQSAIAKRHDFQHDHNGQEPATGMSSYNPTIHI